MEICGTAEHTVPATNMSAQRELQNSNALINENSIYGDSYFYEKANGIKTGHTSAAGYCLVSSAKNDSINVIAVVMGSTAVDQGNGTLQINSFTDSITLYDWAFANFSYRDILRETELIAQVPISMASGTDSVSVRPQDSVTLLLPNDANINDYEREVVIYSERDGEELMAPLDAGVVLGEINITKNGEFVGSSLLISSTGVELSKVEYMKQQISEALHNNKLIRVVRILIILLCLYFIWVIIYRVRHFIHLNSVRKAKKARARAIADREAGRISQTVPGQSEPDFDFYSDSDIRQDPLRTPQETDPFSEQDSGSTDSTPDYYDQFFK